MVRPHLQYRLEMARFGEPKIHHKVTKGTKNTKKDANASRRGERTFRFKATDSGVPVLRLREVKNVSHGTIVRSELHRKNLHESLAVAFKQD